MQAKILDFASDKIVKSLNRIDKQDIKNVVSKVSSKFGRKDKGSRKSELTEGSTSHQHKEKVEEDLKAPPVDSTKDIEKIDKPDSVLEIETENPNQDTSDSSLDTDGN